jgi:hypothetical protein
MPPEVRKLLFERIKTIRDMKEDRMAEEYLQEEIRLAKQFGIDIETLREFKRSTESGEMENDEDCIMDLDDEFEDDAAENDRRGNSNDFGITISSSKKPSRNGAAEVFGSRGSKNTLKDML